MTKPSERMMRLAREITSIAATDWTESETDQFLDAISPSLRRQLLIDNLSGGNAVVIDYTVDQRNRAKISAIKEVRSVTGLGLREAKLLVDAADGHSVSSDGVRISNQLPYNMSSTDRHRLDQNLRGTGYRLV